MKFWFGKKGMESGAGACEVLTISDQGTEAGATHSSSILITPQAGGAPVPQPVMAPVPQPVVAAEARGSVAGAGVAVGAARTVAGTAQPAAAAAVEVPRMPVVPAQAGKGGAVSVQAPGNRFQVGLSGSGAAASADASKAPRPVMTPVRMAASTAPVKLTPVSAAPSPAPAPVAPAASAALPVAAGTARPLAAASAPSASPAFGFRPKDGAVAVPLAAAAAKGPVPLGGVAGAAPIAAAPGLRPLAAAGAGVPAAPDRGPGGVVERDADGMVRPKTDQRALYYQLMNGLYDAVLILDDQGHIVDCNSRVTAMLGYSREDTWDVPIEKIITGMSSQMFEHLRRNLAENHHILIDARCFRQDGTSFAGEVGVSTLSLTRGSNIVFAIRNVDRRKSAMDEMRKGHSALEVALAPAFVCDLDGFFLIVNQAMLDAFGIPDEAQAKNVRFIDLLPDAARFFLRASCGEKLRESLRIPTPGGAPVRVELALKPVQTGQTVTAVAGSLLQA